jgi:hypothetical protein
VASDADDSVAPSAPAGAYAPRLCRNAEVRGFGAFLAQTSPLHVGVISYAEFPSRHAPESKGTMASNPLVGTWRLVSWENRSVVDGRVSYPLGEAAVGYLLYGDDGYMSVSIMSPERLMFAADDLLSGTEAERAQAASTYVAYCGRYEFRGETVVHQVELSLFPNWVGVEQERLVEVSEDTLTLSTRPLVFGGEERTAHLIWKAVGAFEEV